jgi:uncharacterized protein (TIGR02118 family)
MTWEEFSKYWREVHAPLVKARQEVLGIRRYVQVRTWQNDSLHAAFQRRNDGAPAPFDGIAELWYDDDFSTRPRTEESAKAAAELLADERNFIDLANSPLWMGHETEVIG